MTITTTSKNTGSCLVMVPSYASAQNVVAMKNGSSGMTTRVTTDNTMRWNSSSKCAMPSAFAHTQARPSKTARTSALMTGMI